MPDEDYVHFLTIFFFYFWISFLSAYTEYMYLRKEIFKDANSELDANTRIL